MYSQLILVLTDTKPSRNPCKNPWRTPYQLGTHTDRKLCKKPCRTLYQLANGFSCMGQVRAAAYGALAAYPMDLLETLEALRPLKQYVQLLVSEAHVVARVEAEILMGKALAHEHMRRRRSVTFVDRTSTACHEIVDILWHAVIAGCVYERLTRTCMHGIAFAISCTAELYHSHLASLYKFVCQGKARTSC